MPIPQFDQMDLYNRIMYEANLFEGAAAGLKTNGQPDQAKKLRGLFRTRGEKGGVAQLEKTFKSHETRTKRMRRTPTISKRPAR
jgi:hypothetical protein